MPAKADTQGCRKLKRVKQRICQVRDNSSDNTGLTVAEISKFKVLLLAKRNELLGNVSFMEIEALRQESSDLSRLPIHMADIGTDSYDQEFTLGLMDSERKLITEIDDALNRIENRTYGICEVNGELIPKERLRAIPWTRHCLACASLTGKKPLRKKDFFNKYRYAPGIDDEHDVE
jgi:DnaK suppressor protein